MVDEHAVLGEERPVSQVLLDLKAEAEQGELTIGRVIDSLESRAFGMLLIIFALPVAIPFLYGIPQIVSVPMLMLAGQMVAGREAPWLPDNVRARSLPQQSFIAVVRRGVPVIRWFEKISKPRLQFITGRKAERVIGLFLCLFCLSIMVPLPLTNTFPGIAVAIVAIGFIERDGVLVLVGTLFGTAWVGFLIAVPLGLTAYTVDQLFFGEGAEGVGGAEGSGATGEGPSSAP